MTKRPDDPNREPARPATSTKNPRRRARSSTRTTTPARRAAARRNGRHGHGPTTSAGKARSSQNALRHGLTSPRVILPGDDPKVYATFRDRLWRDLAPQGALQTFFAALAIVAMWKAQLADRIETGARLPRRCATNKPCRRGSRPTASPTTPASAWSIHRSRARRGQPSRGSRGRGARGRSAGRRGHPRCQGAQHTRNDRAVQDDPDTHRVPRPARTTAAPSRGGRREGAGPGGR